MLFGRPQIIFYISTSVNGTPSQIPAFDLQSLKLLHPTRRCIYKKVHYFTFDLHLGQGRTQNIAQYPLHHMTYAPAKFEAAMPNCLGGKAFTRNILFDLDPKVKGVKVTQNVAQYP